MIVVQVRARLHVVVLEWRCIVVDRRCRESEGKAKIEGYMSISDEEAHHHGWVSLRWILTFWVPNLLLVYVGRTWQEKLTLNILIWFVCACAIFVIAFLGNVICPTGHIFSTSELQSHLSTLSPNHHIQCHCDFYDIPWIGQYLLSC